MSKNFNRAMRIMKSNNATCSSNTGSILISINSERPVQNKNYIGISNHIDIGQMIHDTFNKNK